MKGHAFGDDADTHDCNGVLFRWTTVDDVRPESRSSHSCHELCIAPEVHSHWQSRRFKFNSITNPIQPLHVPLYLQQQ